MKHLLCVAAMLAAAASTPVLAADVAVSLSVGQPGFYGQIDIGDYPPPRLIYQQPRYVGRVAVDRPPIYLHVPPGHSKNWRKYCRRYNACGEPVYFVQNSWYAREYVPRYQQHYVGRRDAHGDPRRDDYRGGHGGNGHDQGRHR